MQILEITTHFWQILQDGGFQSRSGRFVKKINLFYLPGIKPRFLDPLARSLGMYVVWQESKGTDFLLTMNFILFTNQRYPLQNSSIGQLHSDGGVVSIVRSSAGRLLLVCLSARRLRSSGYYPKFKMAPFQVVFEKGE